MDFVIEKKFKSWDRFKDYISSELKDDHINTKIFRGQGNSKWDLTTSLERSAMKGEDSFLSEFSNIETAEIQMINEFKVGMNNYIDFQNHPNSYSEILALMQHHGIPTRSLDFTFSPYIASYFAFENPSNDAKNIAIWMLDIVILLDKLNLLIQQESIHSNLDKIAIELYTGKLYKSDIIIDSIVDKNNLQLVFPLNIIKRNIRYNFQQSYMLASGNSMKKFIENLEVMMESTHFEIYKFTIPVSEKKNAMRDLDRMNINAEVLFPGLDGFAKGITQRYGNKGYYDQITQGLLKMVKRDSGILD